MTVVEVEEVSSSGAVPYGGSGQQQLGKEDAGITVAQEQVKTSSLGTQRKERKHGSGN